jgi:hypothetical protein
MFNRKAPFPLNLWGWNILVFIGFAQIICYHAVSLSREMRVLLGVIIAFASEFIREYLALNQDDPILGPIHFFVVSTSPNHPILPYMAFCFFSTIFAEMFFEAMLIETRAAYMSTFYSFMKFGAIFLASGLLLGFQLQTPQTINPEEYPFINLLTHMQDQEFFDIAGIPKFLIQGTAANQFYALGCALLILGAAFYFIDIRQLNQAHLYFGKWEVPLGTGVEAFIFIGRVSLSLFFIHFVGMSLFLRRLTAFTIFPVALGLIGFLAILMYIWNKFFDGKYSFEWLMAGGKS